MQIKGTDTEMIIRPNDQQRRQGNLAHQEESFTREAKQTQCSCSNVISSQPGKSKLFLWRCMLYVVLVKRLVATGKLIRKRIRIRAIFDRSTQLVVLMHNMIKRRNKDLHWILPKKRFTLETPAP